MATICVAGRWRRTRLSCARSAARAEHGTPVLGICNGFQILTEAGMLPGALLPNRSLQFTCRDVHLRVENNQTIFTCGYHAGQTIRVPVAHHDGNYTAAADTLDRLEGEGRIAFRYCAPDGSLDEDANFNGSAHAIAGIFNASRTVLGLMPHPENATDPDLGGTDGAAFFAGLLARCSDAVISIIAVSCREERINAKSYG